MDQLNEEKPWLTGLELQHRLTTLSQTAMTEHRRCRESWRGALEYARTAGEALVEAQWRLGRRSKWGRWKRALEDLSPRTVRQYMQIARHWDDPRMVEMRNNGVEIKSIQQFLNLLRGKHPHTQTPPTAQQIEVEANRTEAYTNVRKFIGKLDPVELRVLARTAEPLMERLYDELRQIVAYVEEGYYEQQDPVGNATQQRRRRRVRLRRVARQ